MRLSWRSEYKEEIQTLKLKRDPMCGGLGYYEDINGVTWDVTCIIGGAYTESGKPYINARPVDGSPYYSTSVSGHSNGFHRWKPYYFEVVKETVLN